MVFNRELSRKINSLILFWWSAKHINIRGLDFDSWIRIFISLHLTEYSLGTWIQPRCEDQNYWLNVVPPGKPMLFIIELDIFWVSF